MEKYSSGAQSEAELADSYAEFLASIMRRNPEQFERSVQSIVQTILDTHKNPQKSPQKVRLELIRLIQRTEEYCINCDVAPERMRLYDDTVISRVLSCNYVAGRVPQACHLEKRACRSGARAYSVLGRSEY